VLLSLHTSPVWMQNDEPSLHTPASHSFEQHCRPSVQGLPAVRHPVLSTWHRPPLQLPLQHAAPSTQVCPSAVQALALHRPAEQLIEQHSVDVTHGPPVAVQVLIEVTQVALAGSQIPEQHWLLLVQAWVMARQNGEGATSLVPMGASPNEMFGASLPPVLPALPSGYLPMVSVLLQATSAESAKVSTDGQRSELGMMPP